MGVVHIILAEFQPLTTLEEVQGVCDRLLALKDKCLHPTTNKPYVKSLVGGRDTSPAGLQRGMTHAFVAEFESEEDWKYYNETDPAHKEFLKGISGLVAQIQVVDFAPGAF
ncbi:hypothetical protein GQ53DRAFT_827573 [Thozetella sp. PMI_491]|nr:hypothetical protein GQ53DRAFT_827573 [Thozetella sp. PMI_491]